MAIGIDPNVMRTLTKPGFTQGMFEFGSALGGIGAQRRNRQKQQEINEIMKEAQRAQQAKDPTALFGAAQQLRTLGENEQADALAKAAEAIQKAKDQQGLAGGLFGIQQLTTEGVDTKDAVGSAVALGATPEQIAAAQKRGVEEQTRLRDVEQLKNLRAAAVAKATKARDPFKRAAMENASKEELMAYLNPALYQINAGMGLVDADGNTVADRGFKPNTVNPSHDQKIVKDADGNETLILLTNNEKVGEIKVKPIGNETTEEARARAEAIPKLIHNIGKLDNLLLREELPSGLGAQLTRNIGSVESLGYEAAALDVEAEYQQIKNFLGLDNIRVLKQLGGGSTGLGAVSNLELTALQNSIETLNTSRSEAAQREALKNIKKHLNTMLIMAQGRDLTEAVDWNSDEYTSLGYRSILNNNKETVVFYKEPGTGRRFVYDKTTATFKPLSSGE